MRTAALVLALMALAILPRISTAQDNSDDCLLSLAATADNAVVSRGGRMVAAVADTSGSCAFTLSACIDDTNLSGCSVGEVNRIRIMSSGNDATIAGLQQSLQGQMPTSERTCTQTNVTLALQNGPDGPVRQQRRIRAAVRTADGRGDADSLMLLCQPSTFLRIQRGIFNASCTSLSCHSSQVHSGNMILEEGVALDNLIRVDPDNAVARQLLFKRVSPGVDATSFLLKKLEGPDEGEGALMPQGTSGLSADRIALIRAWILAGAPATGVVPGDRGGFAAARQPLIDPPPPPADGIQVKLPLYMIPPKGEREICQYFRLPNETDMYITGFEMSMHPGSHHFILYTYDGTAFDQFPDGPVDDPGCLNFGPGEGAFGYRFITGSQTPYYQVPFPQGVAIHFAPHQAVILNSHFINYWDAPEHGEVWTNIHTTDLANVTHMAEIIFDVNFTFSVEPFSKGDTSKTWIAPFDAYVFGLTSHMHKRGAQFVIKKNDGRQVGDEVYRSGSPPNTWRDPLNKPFDPPMLVKRGQGFTYTCTHDNGSTPDHPVRMGCDGTSKDIFETTYSCVSDADCVDVATCNHGQCGNSTKGCTSNDDCGPPGTGKCVPQALRFGFTGNDDMCIMPGLYFRAVGGASGPPPTNAVAMMQANLQTMSHGLGSHAGAGCCALDR